MVTTSANHVRDVQTHEQFLQILQEATAANQLVVVDYYAIWCGPCKKIGPFYDELANFYNDIIFTRVDVDENEETAAFANVSAMPTFQTYRNGQKLKEVVGASQEKLLALIHDDNPWITDETKM